MLHYQPGLLGGIESFFENGSVIIEAPQSTATHDGADPEAATVHVEGDSLQVPVRRKIVAPVAVFIFDRETAEDVEVSELTSLYEGVVATTEGLLRIHDPASNAEFVAVADSGSTRINVLVDNADDPSTVTVLLK